MEAQYIYIGLAAAFGLFMAWGIGANDVANAMATSVGSKALTIRQAILVAAIFEFAGAVLAGGEVTSTIRKGIVDADLLIGVDGGAQMLVYGMLAALLAAGTWLLIASRNGWPVSTTHSIVGAIVGFAAVGIGMDAVQWGKVGTIVMSWVVSPLVYCLPDLPQRAEADSEPGRSLEQSQAVRPRLHVPRGIHNHARYDSEGSETCRPDDQPAR
jgi:PiT family inorganic phosphate transporter